MGCLRFKQESLSNSSSDIQGITLQSCTKLKRFDIGSFLITEVCRGEYHKTS